jgi:DedD protein
MREPNPRARPSEKFELALDGRAVASIVVGALVVLAVVFVLGLNVGRQIAVRQTQSARAGDLDALDRAPAPPAPAAAEVLTFHDRLTKAPPPRPPPPIPAAVAAAPPPHAAPPPATAEPAAPPPPGGEAAPPAGGPDPVAPAPSRGETPPAAWTVQLAAAHDPAEARRIAARFAGLSPRIEEADVPGKGRFHRVRVGGFETREAAERYLRDAERETGAKGFVTPAR